MRVELLEQRVVLEAKDDVNRRGKQLVPNVILEGRVSLGSDEGGADELAKPMPEQRVGGPDGQVQAEGAQSEP